MGVGTTGENGLGESLTQLASDYFDWVAERFPVMCASDEFPFLPRARNAGHYYDRLDDLSADAIEEAIEALKEFQRRLNGVTISGEDLEGILDVALLRGNMSGALIELDRSRSWRHNPLLYLKIAFLGLDHALSKPASGEKEIRERARARLAAMPRLLQQAQDNLEGIPETHHQAALLMLADCRGYLAEIAEGVGRSLSISLKGAHAALGGFEALLRARSPLPDRDLEGPSVEAILGEHFGSPRSLSEVFEIAVAEWRENLETLERLQLQIDPQTTWRELYHAYFPTDLAKLDTITLYRVETERLQHFFQELGFPEVDGVPVPEVRETPGYLKSVRSSASFAAAFTTDPRERDTFYVTTSLPSRHSEEAGDLLRQRLHREYRFLSAHETFPGHHLLDFVRRNLKNPIRAQIESPLFYEGWAYYVESLLSECGYVEQPLDRLVDHKRRLWRAARCQIDVGLAGGLLDHARALELLTTAGFSREEARHQVDRFRLNPGYQLCYTLGRYEMVRLKERHGNRLGWGRFHREVLLGGELPFHLAEQRLASLGSANKPLEHEG